MPQGGHPTKLVLAYLACGERGGILGNRDAPRRTVGPHGFLHRDHSLMRLRARNPSDMAVAMRALDARIVAIGRIELVCNCGVHGLPWGGRHAYSLPS
jgi:hypothetical protein